MTRAAIEAAIPHRPPFLLLDEVVEQTDERIVCRRHLSGEEFWFAGHYPDYPLMPGVLLCEACLQAGAVLLARFSAGVAGVPVATRMNDVRFKRMVRPGETMQIEVALDERVSNAFYMSGKVSVDGKLAARLSFACAVTSTE